MINDESKENSIDHDVNYDSNILLTQYSFEASQSIKSVTKKISFVIIILMVIASVIFFDLVMNLGITNILSDETIDAMIISLSILLIAFLLFAVCPLLKYQKILEKWSNLFENNAIRTGILLGISNKSKDEILNAISEAINEINVALHQYLSKSDNKEFYNVSVDDTTTFDILIDKSTIKSDIDSSALKKTIQDYGSILVKVVDESIDKNITQAFIECLQKYKMKKDNKIGLALLIGENIEQESYKLINKIKDKNIRKNLILIEKSNYIYFDLNLNNVLT